jgi:hypothetical protein
MNNDTFYSSSHDVIDGFNTDEMEAPGANHLSIETDKDYYDRFSTQQRIPMSTTTSYIPARITRRATISTPSRWCQTDDQQLISSTEVIDDDVHHANISAIDIASSLLMEQDADPHLSFDNRTQARYQQQMYLEGEQRLIGERNMISQTRLPLGRRPRSNHEPQAAQQQRRQELANPFWNRNQFLDKQHSTLPIESNMNNSLHNHAASSIRPEYPLAFNQDVNESNAYRNSSSRRQHFTTSTSPSTHLSFRNDSDVDDIADLHHRETSRSMHDIYTARPMIGNLNTSSLHNESLRSFASLNDVTGHSNSQHYGYNRRAPSSSSLNVVSYHSNASNNIGTGTGHGFPTRRQVAPYQHQQQQQQGLLFGSNRISDHENLYAMDASSHSISSFHSEFNQLDTSQSDRIDAFSLNDSSPSLHQRRRSSYRRLGTRTMQMSSNHSDHSSMAQVSRHSTNSEGVNATLFGHLQHNYPQEDLLHVPLQDPRPYGEQSTFSPHWNQNHRSHGVRHLLNHSEHTSTNTLPKITPQQQVQLQAQDAATFSQHIDQQSEHNTSFPSSDLVVPNSSQSARNRIFSIFTKDSFASASTTTQSAGPVSSTPTSASASPTSEFEANRRKRGRTKSNQNMGEMRRVPFRAPSSKIDRQNSVRDTTRDTAATTTDSTTTENNNNNDEDDNVENDSEALDGMEVNSLLHKSCKFYPETRVVIESALQLDFDAIRRPVPVMCVGTTTARRNSLGYVGPELLTCIQLMKGITIDESGDDDDTITLKQPGDCYSYPVNIALMSGAQLDVIELLANAGSDVLTHSDGPEEANSLGIAVAHGCDIDVIRLLLVANIDTAQGYDRHYNLPLHIAVRSGTASKEILTTIHNAYPEGIGCKNFHGLTPLEVAIRSPFCSDSTVDLLQEIFDVSLEADDLKFDEQRR